MTNPVITTDITSKKRIYGAIISGGREVMEVETTLALRPDRDDKFYFTIVGTVWRRTYQGDRIEPYDRWGSLNDEIEKFFPNLSYLLKWHLFSLEDGPFGYLDGGLFWYDVWSKHVNLLDRCEETLCPFCDNYEYFRSDDRPFLNAVLWGEVEEDTHFEWRNVSREDLESYLKSRLPALKKKFMTVMRRAGLEL